LRLVYACPDLRMRPTVHGEPSPEDDLRALHCLRRAGRCGTPLRTMRKRRPHPASLDEVRIIRAPDGESVAIEYADEQVRTTQITVGPRLRSMSDAQVLRLFNDMLRESDEARRQEEHVAVEIPVGQPQIYRAAVGAHWMPRGDVLRCVIDDPINDAGVHEPLIHIDDEELSWTEFGRMLMTHSGWGMRIVFVAEDETHESPTIEVREPGEET
jgi:hypothetical protein